MAASSASGVVAVTVKEIRDIAAMWHGPSGTGGVSAKLKEIGTLVQGMKVKGGAADTNLFPNSLPKYSAVVASADRSCQQGTAITDGMGIAMEAAAFVFDRANVEALAAVARLSQKIQELGNMP